MSRNIHFELTSRDWGVGGLVFNADRSLGTPIPTFMEFKNDIPGLLKKKSGTYNLI